MPNVILLTVNPIKHHANWFFAFYLLDCVSGHVRRSTDRQARYGTLSAIFYLDRFLRGTQYLYQTVEHHLPKSIIKSKGARTSCFSSANKQKKSLKVIR